MSIWIWLGLAAGLLLVLALVGGLAWRRSDAATRALLRRLARLSLGDKLRLARTLAGDRRIPLPVRALPPAVVLYLALPLDLIPDFIPVLGQLDDILIVGLALALLLRFTPRDAIEDGLSHLRSDRG